jgi:hypothetical protein
MELILTILDELAPRIIPEGLDLARQKTLKDFRSRGAGAPPSLRLRSESPP